LITTNFDSILRAPGRIGAGVDSAALTVLKKYTRNDDREVLEDAYSNAATKYLTLPDSDDRRNTHDSGGTFKHRAGGEERRSGTIRLVQDCAGDRGERVC
jgi:hypothetical protein